jgi:nitric oxide reductase subunit C
MPNFKLSEQDLDNVIEFMRWSSEIDLQGWPPKRPK